MTSNIEMVKKIAESIDSYWLSLMKNCGAKIEGQRHFNDEGMSSDEKISVKRLLDLGIIVLKSAQKKFGFEYAYYWTEFGDEVMRYLDIINTLVKIGDKKTKESIYFYKNPLFWTIVGVMIAGVGLIWTVYKDIYPPVPTSITQSVSTSTINISDIFSKALNLDTVVERQDFLAKYIGNQVYGRGVVGEVSRSGSIFLVDIKVDSQAITCLQEENQENEKQLLLLKGKNINFVGAFTYQRIFEHGLEIKDC